MLGYSKCCRMTGSRSQMNNNSAALKSFITFCGDCATGVAFWIFDDRSVGYFLNVRDWYCVAAILAFPLILRWHYQLMLFCVNASLGAFFVPGHPPMWLAAVPLSFGIAILHRALSKDARFISVPQVTWPLLFLLLVITVTAKLTGWGIRVMGSDVYGGKTIHLFVGRYTGLLCLRIQTNPT